MLIRLSFFTKHTLILHPFQRKIRVKTYVWPTRKAIFRTLLNHYFALFGLFTYILGFYLERFLYFLRSPTTNFRRNLSKKTESKMQQITSLTARDSLAFCSILRCVLVQLAVLKPGFYTSIMKEQTLVYKQSETKSMYILSF